MSGDWIIVIVLGVVLLIFIVFSLIGRHNDYISIYARGMCSDCCDATLTGWDKNRCGLCGRLCNRTPVLTPDQWVRRQNERIPEYYGNVSVSIKEEPMKVFCTNDNHRVDHASMMESTLTRDLYSFCQKCDMRLVRRKSGWEECLESEWHDVLGVRS